MIRTTLSALALASLCGCASVAQMPLGKPAVDPNLSIIDAYFSGPSAGQTQIAEQTADSLRMQQRALGVAPNGQIDRYLNDVLARLQRSLPDQPAAARVYATPNTEFNAASYQDGGIFIPYKVLDALESEDELAALIAHEYAHVLLRHHKTNWINTAATLAHSAGKLYINSKGSTAVENELQRMLLVNEATLGASQIGLMPMLTRAQENDADRLGVDLLIRAGYSYIGAMNFMSRMENWEAVNEAILEKRRTNYIDLFAKTEQHVLAKSIDGQLDLLEDKFTGLLRRAKRHHDAGDDRTAALRAYLKQHYANSARPVLQVEPYAAVLKSPTSKRFFSGLDQAHAASAALLEENAAQALQYARLAVESPAASVPFTRHALISALTFNGKEKDAFAQLQRDVDAGRALFNDELLLLSQLKQSSPEKALALAQRSYERHASAVELLPELIELNKQMNNSLMVLQLYGICAGKALSSANSALLESCNKAKG